VEIVETISARFARGGKAKRATGAALAKPEAGARIAVIKRDAHFHVAVSGAEAVDGLGLPCFGALANVALHRKALLSMRHSWCNFETASISSNQAEAFRERFHFRDSRCPFRYT
jgi:hypothetical protein